MNCRFPLYFVATCSLAFLFFSGCVSYNSTPLLDQGSLTSHSEVGVVLVSNGRLQNGMFSLNSASNVNWYVYAVDADGNKSEEIVWFIPWEDETNTALMNPGRFLGKGTYGFIYFSELPAGKYRLLAVADSRGTLVVGGYFIPGSSGRQSGVELEIEVEGGKINYIGEIMSVGSGEDSKADFRISDELERDLAYAIGKKANLANFEVITTLVKPVK